MMPLSDGNPFVLARLAPGVAYNGDLKFSRPFDNGGTSGINADGATGGNEFTLDGSPNMANGRRVAFVPPAGAVQEFKVETASFDAGERPHGRRDGQRDAQERHQPPQGRRLHYYARDKLAATDFFVKKTGTAKPELGYKRPGFTLGGPVVLPGLRRPRQDVLLRRGRMALRQVPRAAVRRRVPTQAMRNGDFSALLAQGIQIYDPLSAATQVGARVVRQPFPGNIIPPNRINPIAQQLLKYYPLPNQAGDTQGPQQLTSTTNPRTDTFYSISTRVDHRITDKQRAVRALHPQQPPRVAQRHTSARSTASCPPATSSIASTTA